jgi:hypothetical protein
MLKQNKSISFTSHFRCPGLELNIIRVLKKVNGFFEKKIHFVFLARTGPGLGLELRLKGIE